MAGAAGTTTDHVMTPGATDPFRFTTIAHANRTLLGPVSGASIDAMLEVLAQAGAGSAAGAPKSCRASCRPTGWSITAIWNSPTR